MVELDEQTTSEASRHIIERPRLTRLLDEATARVIMLVAPAGYGKTTLARQWLADRPHVWFEARPSSADMAALGADLIEAAEGAIPNVGSRYRSHPVTARRPPPTHKPEVTALVQREGRPLRSRVRNGYLDAEDEQR